MSLKAVHFCDAPSQHPGDVLSLVVNDTYSLARLRGVISLKTEIMQLIHSRHHVSKGSSFLWRSRLERLLRSVDSRKPQFIGQAGRGNQEEFGLLSLEYDENFCMGGPGVLLSRETLARVAPHVKTCLRNLYTTHEDVELGRCVQKFAGIPCTWSYEVRWVASRVLTKNYSSDLTMFL